MAPNINSFKNRLESYKLDCISSANERPGNFWELSDAVLSRIEGANYADNKSLHNEFLKRNPYVAKRKLINMHRAPSFRFFVYCFSLLELVGTFLLNEFFFHRCCFWIYLLCFCTGIFDHTVVLIFCFWKCVI